LITGVNGTLMARRFTVAPGRPHVTSSAPTDLQCAMDLGATLPLTCTDSRWVVSAQSAHSAYFPDLGLRSRLTVVPPAWSVDRIFISSIMVNVIKLRQGSVRAVVAAMIWQRLSVLLSPLLSWLPELRCWVGDDI
jgi:hypothetical protein